MKTDLTTRVLLTAILLCLVLLMVQQRRGAEPLEGAVAGRYVVFPVKSGQKPVLLRADTVTGEMWRADGIPRDTHWVPYGPPALPEDAGAAEGEGPKTGPTGS
jgi:hypothetical protein